MNNIITRRVDELGRIVIPKEIRNALKIKAGDCLNVSLNKEQVIFQKKSLINSDFDTLKDVIKTVSSINNLDIIVTDLDKIIFMNNKPTINTMLYLNSEYIRIISLKKLYIGEKFNIGNVFGENYALQPLIINGDTIGSILLLKDNKLLDTDLLCLKIINNLLTNHLEV